MFHPAHPFRLPKLVLEAFSILTILIFAVISILGQKTLPDVSLPFSFYTATTNEYGIAFYQKQKHVSYLISPYNDYSITNSTRRAVVEIPKTSSVVVTRPQNIFPLNIAYQALTYLGKGQLVYHVKTQHTNAEYSAYITGESLQITRKLTFLQTQQATPDKTGITVLFSRDDVIADQDGNLLTESSDDHQKLLAREILKDIVRNTITTREVKGSGNTVYIMNPHTSGFVTIHVPNAAYMVVNNEAKLVEFVEDVPGASTSFTSTMTITFHDTSSSQQQFLRVEQSASGSANLLEDSL